MRLTCPKCGATYALGADAVPPGGSHVQCGACHTRWFIRPDRPAADTLSEDQIVERLESRAARRAGAPDEDAAAETPDAAAKGSAPIAFPGPTRPIPAAAQPATAPKDTGVQPAPAAPAPAPPPAGAATPLRPRPSVERPAPASPAAAAARGRGGRALGVLTALALAGLALGAYRRADLVAAQVPAAAPALATYAEAVDAGRTWIETRLGPTRDRLIGG